MQPRTTDDSKFNLGATLVQALLKPWQETQRFTFAMQGQRDALPPQERLKVGNSEKENRGKESPVFFVTSSSFSSSFLALQDRLRQEALETGIAHALFDVSGHLPIFITDQSEAPCVTLVCKVVGGSSSKVFKLGSTHSVLSSPPPIQMSQREAGRRNTYTQMHTALPAWVRNCVLDTVCAEEMPYFFSILQPSPPNTAH